MRSYCDVSGCKLHAEEVMHWPKESAKLPLYLCEDHLAYYKSIAGPHMRFENVESQART